MNHHHASSPQELSAYSSGAIFLHWLIALLIIANLLGGFIMMRVASLADSNRFLLFQWHKTIGILVLLATIARIIWRLMNKPPAKAPMSKLEAVTASIVSFLFYILMLAVPLAGWLMVSASPTAIPTLLFLIPGFIWPNLPVGPSESVATLAANVHFFLAYSFVFLLFLHIGGALKHIIFDHVPEMSRMVKSKKLPRLRTTHSSLPITISSVLIVAVGGILIGQLPKHNSTVAQTDTPLTTQNNKIVANWAIDYAKSQFGYHLDFSGAPKNGQITKWNAAVHFDPTNPDQAQAEINLDAASVTYEDSYVAGSIAEPDGLDSANHPQISVILDKFTQDGNNWLAEGQVTIRSVTRPIKVPFSFLQQNGRAKVTGSAEIERLAFGIGQQNDAEAAWLGKTIHVRFSLEANAIQ